MEDMLKTKSIDGDVVNVNMQAEVLRGSRLILQAAAAQALGEAATAARLAAEGRAIFDQLAYPPARIVALAQQLPH